MQPRVIFRALGPGVDPRVTIPPANVAPDWHAVLLARLSINNPQTATNAKVQGQQY
jgi:hypothetical protein